MTLLGRARKLIPRPFGKKSALSAASVATPSPQHKRAKAFRRHWSVRGSSLSPCASRQAQLPGALSEALFALCQPPITPISPKAPGAQRAKSTRKQQDCCPVRRARSDSCTVERGESCPVRRTHSDHCTLQIPATQNSRRQRGSPSPSIDSLDSSRDGVEDDFTGLFASPRSTPTPSPRSAGSGNVSLCSRVSYFSDSEARTGRRRPIPPPISVN
mmetsp:Transcript_115081/g.215399  ORF Transcript_115081/g.215399 Transcript_115081/m.215399 type:complete len:215 (+) Transcript_115081:93-737(+)